MARPAIAQQRTPLTVAAYGGVFEKVLREQVIPRFEADNPHSVTLVVTDDSNIIPRLLTARGRSPWDVITINNDAAILLRAHGLLAPVARVNPKEGVYAQRTGTQIPNGSSNPAGALAWVRTSLSAAYQTAFVSELYSPANRTVSIPSAQAANFIAGEEDVAQLRDPPWETLLPQRDAVLDRWRRELG